MYDSVPIPPSVLLKGGTSRGDDGGDKGHSRYLYSPRPGISAGNTQCTTPTASFSGCTVRQDDPPSTPLHSWIIVEDNGFRYPGTTETTVSFSRTGSIDAITAAGVAAVVREQKVSSTMQRAFTAFIASVLTSIELLI